MVDYELLIVSPETKVIDAMAVIDKNSKGIVFICDGEILKATLTDGDIRRHILRKGGLNAPVGEIGNSQFKYTTHGQSDKTTKLLTEKWKHIPMIDEKGRIIGVSSYDNAEHPHQKPQINIPVVIMAGGKGSRLYPYTSVLPKPLIPLGELTITEHIMNSFIKYGCNDFSMIVNHKKNMIKAYFSDKENGSYKVDFFEEDKPLGTGGGLSLLRNKINETFFMTNCDIIVFEDYSKILEHHLAAKNLLTVVCSTKEFTIPYGSVEIDDDGKLVSITEKPQFASLVNTGLYVIEPEFLNCVPQDSFWHITDLIISCVEKGIEIGIYPVGESQWADMGQHDEMKRMLKMLKERHI